MNRLSIAIAIAAAGVVVWVIQARSIHELRAELDHAKQPAPADGTPAAAPGAAARPMPTRTRQTGGARLAAPERRDAQPAPDASRGAAPVVAHLAGELADQMNLDAGRRARVLALLERHIQLGQKATAALLDSGSNLLVDTTGLEENVLSGFVDHAAFHAAARELNVHSTRDIDPLIDKKGKEILQAHDAIHRTNTIRLLADNDYIAWKEILGFSGVEQEAYDVFRDLSEFRVANPLPEGFTREELATRISDERRFLSESLSAIVGEEKAQSIRTAIEPPAPGR